MPEAPIDAAPVYPGLAPQPLTPPVYPGLEPVASHQPDRPRDPASQPGDVLSDASDRGAPRYPGLAAAPTASTSPGSPTPGSPAPGSPSPAYPATVQYPAGGFPATVLPPAAAPATTPAEVPSPAVPPAGTTPLTEPPSADPPPSATGTAPYSAASVSDSTASVSDSAPRFAAATPPEAPSPIVEPPADIPVYGGFETLGLVPSTYIPEPEPSQPMVPAPLTEPPAETAFGGMPPASMRGTGDHVPRASAPADDSTDDPAGGSTPGGYPAASAAAESLARRDDPVTPVHAPGTSALLPTAEPVGEPPEDFEKATTIEKVGLGVAVVGGPLGLGFAIVNAARGLRRRGWLIGIAKASLVLGVLSTIAAAIGGVALWNAWQDQLAHDEVAAASATFCAAAAETPELVEPPLLGWPAPGATITESLASMTAWTARWTELAPQVPEELGAGMELLAENGQTIIDSVTSARVVDDAGNRTLIESVAGRSGVASWHDTYCAS